jgi:hypothetical protein
VDVRIPTSQFDCLCFIPVLSFSVNMSVSLVGSKVSSFQSMLLKRVDSTSIILRKYDEPDLASNLNSVGGCTELDQHW